MRASVDRREERFERGVDLIEGRVPACAPKHRAVHRRPRGDANASHIDYDFANSPAVSKHRQPADRPHASPSNARTALQRAQTDTTSQNPPMDCGTAAIPREMQHVIGAETESCRKLRVGANGSPRQRQHFTVVLVVARERPNAIRRCTRFARVTTISGL